MGTYQVTDKSGRGFKASLTLDQVLSSFLEDYEAETPLEEEFDSIEEQFRYYLEEGEGIDLRAIKITFIQK